MSGDDPHFFLRSLPFSVEELHEKPVRYWLPFVHSRTGDVFLERGFGELWVLVTGERFRVEIRTPTEHVHLCQFWADRLTKRGRGFCCRVEAEESERCGVIHLGGDPLPAGLRFSPAQFEREHQAWEASLQELDQ